MFDGVVGELDAGAALAVAADLHAFTHRAESQLLQVAAHWADLNAPDPEGERVPAGGERYLVHGGEGCPRVGEFACAELGAALGVSSRAAAGLIGDALGLRHRMPRLWAGVLAGRVAVWRARRIATACVTLSRAAARVVDAQVAEIADRVGMWRLRRIIDAAIWAVDPDRAQANAEAMARERGVWVGQSDSYGTRTMAIKAAAGDVARLDARVDEIADILADLGDLDTKDQRRAKAIGWLADPESALELLIRHHTTDPDTTDTTDADSARSTDHESGEHCESGNRGTTDTTDNTGPRTAGADIGFTPDSEPFEPEPFDRPGSGPSGADRMEPELRRGEPVGPSPVRSAGSEPGSEPRLDSEGLAGRMALLARLCDAAAGSPQAGQHSGRESGRESGQRSGRRRARRARRVRRARGGGVTGSRYELYVHLSDLTLATGTGLLRTETVGRGKVTGDDLGPLLASQLTELLGPNPATIIVKPVIDLRDQISVDAYEIPDRIREHIRLRYPVCYFPWCNRPAIRCDLDHIQPHTRTRSRDGTDPPGAGGGVTGTENLAPGCRFHHRLKTHGGWNVERLPDGAFCWTSPHGDMYLVDHTGTRLIHRAVGTRATDATDHFGDTAA